LVVVGSEEKVPEALAVIRKAVEGLPEPELKVCRFESAGADTCLAAIHAE
jgi:hypothetical protein